MEKEGLIIFLFLWLTGKSFLFLQILFRNETRVLESKVPCLLDWLLERKPKR